jgi:hypothetical protein
MKVRDTFPAVGPVVDHQAEPRAVQAQPASDLGCPKQQMTQEG